jgi:glutamine---fructose-6-phosphate transaminase (isomerizing)
MRHSFSSIDVRAPGREEDDGGACLGKNNFVISECSSRTVEVARRRRSGNDKMRRMRSIPACGQVSGFGNLAIAGESSIRHYACSEEPSMCGIVGYIGKQQAGPLILEGLRRLEYRGYDSAGLAVVRDHSFELRKKKGKIDEGLAKLLISEPAKGQIGIGHTRWATHGGPSDENSHPHYDQKGRVAVVHNGIIENYERLKERLKGHKFRSATDTEVLAHLIGEHYDRICAKPSANGTHPLASAVMDALREVIGAYGIAVVCTDFPDVIVGARRGSPLIVGVGDGENFLASDATAIAPHTRQVIYLNDYDVVTLTKDNFLVANLGSDTAQVQISQLEFDAEAAERGDFAHYMLKEIFEQPRTVENALRGRINHEEGTAKFGGLNLSVAELRAVDQIVITACGTSWHAGLVGEYLLEEFAHIPVEVEYASEFRYRNAPIEKNAIRRNRRYAGEPARNQAPRP